MPAGNTTTAVADPLIGQTVHHFQIVSRLGSGGMGRVYLAEDPRLDRQVALKLLAPEYTQDADRVRRFEREARAASALNHPNIVTIHDIGESDAGRFIVMELVLGKTLRPFTSKPPPLHVLGDIGRQIAEALEVAHAAGIVHRDIKPQNIMLRDDGYVKVLDFGLVRLVPTAKVASGDETESLEMWLVPTGKKSEKTPRSRGEDPETTRSDMLLGTAPYMSPEQAQGQPVTSASDMFSLGIVLYQLATGKHPFAADSPLGYVSGIVSRAPLPPSRLRREMSPDLERLILRLLEKSAPPRPTAADVRESLSPLARRGGEMAPRSLAAPKRTVGRERELARLRESYQRTAAGRGELVCVAGEPGIGKTTLVEEFLHTLAAEGHPAQVGRGRCSERLEGTEAYLPILEALYSLVQQDREAVSEVFKAYAPTWFLHVVPLSSADSSAERVREDIAVASQERMKRELAAALSELTRQRPVLLFLDDLHWADVATVELLAFLTTKFDEMRILVLAALRPTEMMLARNPFTRVKLDLESRGLCWELPLGFLTHADVERYLALECPDHTFPREFVDLVHRKTEGSPLFMVDLVRHLRDREMIAESDGRWKLASSVSDVEDELPASVRSMVDRKIDQLQDDDRSLLAAASVQGDQFDAAVIAEAMGTDAVEVEDRLERLERVHGLIRRVGEHEFPDGTLSTRYRFVHALYQNSFHESLNPARRVAWSRAVGQSLVDLHDEQTHEIAGDLAFLFQSGREFGEAADRFHQAATNATAVHAYDEALELLRRSTACAERLKGSERCRRVWMAAMLEGQVLETMSRFDDAVEAFQEAEEAACNAQDKDAQVTAICARASVLLQLQKTDEMRSEGERALEVARASESDIGVATAEMVLGTHRACVGHFAEADAFYDRGMVVLQSVPSDELSTQARWGFGYRAFLHAWRREYQAARRNGQIAMTGPSSAAGFNYLHMQWGEAYMLGNEGKLSQALEILQDTMRLAELSGAKIWISRLPNTMGWVYRELQDIETALRLDGENVPLAQEFQQLEPEVNAHVNLGHDYLQLGEIDRSWEHLQAAQRIYDKDVWFRWRYNLRLQIELARYWIAREDLPQASSHAAACLSAATDAKDPKYVAWAHKLLADIAMLEERVEDAQRHFDAALSGLADGRCPIIHWKVLKAAGDFAHRLKKDNARDQYLGHAREILQRLADSIHDDKLQRRFLSSKTARELRL